MESKFKIGDKAFKPKGYKFPCTIVSIFQTTNGDIRIVGEMDDNGMLHIFNESQLEPIDGLEAVKKRFHNQLNGRNPLTKEDIEHISNSTYFDGSPYQVGDIVLFAMIYGEVTKDDDGNENVQLDMKTLCERHFHLFKLSERHHSNNELPILKLK